MDKKIAGAVVAIAFLSIACTKTVYRDRPPTASTVPSTVPASTEPTAAPTHVPTVEVTEAPAEPNYTVSQQNAIESAKSYLDFAAFSKKGLIQQLSSKYGENFPKADAIFAVNHITVNWNEEAARSAKEYLRTSSFSCQGMIQQLESKYGEAFTHSQAVYGATQTGLCS